MKAFPKMSIHTKFEQRKDGGGRAAKCVNNKKKKGRNVQSDKLLGPVKER